MNDIIKDLMERLNVKDNNIRKEALDKVIELTQDTVDWIYDYWDFLVEKLDSKNSYQRTIGMFIISNLAKSDRENRFEEILDKYLLMTEDEKFITSRQTLQKVWKVAIAKENCKKKIVEHLYRMFTQNKHLNVHTNLIRKDIVDTLCRIYEIDNEAIDLNYLRIIIEANCDEIQQRILKDMIMKAEKKIG